MNRDQWLSILEKVVTAICAALVTKGIITADSAPLVNTLLTTIIPILVGAAVTWWGQHTHRDDVVMSKIATMPQEQAAQAIASLPVAQKAQMTLAATPDKAILAAVNAMPDVAAVTVKPTATDGVAQALNDPKLEKVVPVGTAK